MKYRLDDLQIDLIAERVYRGSDELKVSGLNFKLLAFLLKHDVEVVTFDQIIEGVWSPTQVNNETIAQRVRLLRVALNPTGEFSQYIRSVRGSGYQLCSQPELLLPAKTRLTPSLKLYHLAGAFFLLLSLIFIGVFFTSSEDSSPLTTYQKRLERAQHYLNQGEKADIERALTLLELIQLDGSNDPDWLLAKSFALSASVCRYGADAVLALEAETLSKRALSLDDTATHAFFTLGFSHDCRGHTRQAISYYKQAIERASDPERVNTSALAYLLGETGAIAESLALHKALENLQVREDFLYLQLGRNYELLQYHELAAGYYQLSFELYPDNVFSNVALPFYLFKQGKFEQSRVIMDVAKQRPHHADFYVLQAEHDLLAGDSSAALESLQQAISLQPNNNYYQTLRVILTVPLDSDYLEKRASEIESYSGLEDNAYAALELALVYSTLGHTQKAEQMLVHAIKVGYLDSLLLERSRLFSSLRDLPDFKNTSRLLDQLVVAQRENVPVEHLKMAMAED